MEGMPCHSMEKLSHSPDYDGIKKMAYSPKVLEEEKLLLK